MRIPTVFILGPTAAGKSTVAHHLALELNASILCMDSMQVYQGLEIGVGKPTSAEKNEIPYGGLDLVRIGEPFDITIYLSAAARWIEQAAQMNRPLVVVGGTGLYFRALTAGFSRIPKIDPSVRESLEPLSLSVLQARLRIEDPAIEQFLDFQNPRRVIRALEVKLGTGISLKEWQLRNSPPLIPEFSAYFLHRENLGERIQTRCIQMAQKGWKEEVRQLLLERGPECIRQIAAIGYDHWSEVLSGELSEEEAMCKIQQETWQYARRQLTWFRKESKYQLLNLNSDTPVLSILDSIRASHGLEKPLSQCPPPLLISPLKVQDSSCS